jgi:cobalt-zinc-cadmium efflux system protein
MFVVLGLTTTLMVVELIAGLLSGSLALLADAGHMLSDVAAQGLALLAMWFASKPAHARKTFGYHRTEILASLVNGVLLVGICIFIVAEGIQRLSHPPQVEGGMMLGVAAAGLLVNLISMRLLHSVADSSLNMKAVYLELLGDMLASVGVLVAAVVIYFTHWYLIDPLVSILIGVMIIPRTWLLIAECTNILMEGTPGHIDMDKLRGSIMAVPGVISAHDMHVWSITSGFEAMCAHVTVAESSDADAVLLEITRVSQQEFGIRHTTIQIQRVH